MNEGCKHLAKHRGKGHQILFAELYHSQKSSHSMQVFSLSKQLAQVLQQLLKHYLVHILISQDRARTTTDALANKHFLDGSCRVALVYHFFRLQIVRHHVDNRWDLLIWNLVSEKVDELNAS